jgi:hypothetical protein
MQWGGLTAQTTFLAVADPVYRRAIDFESALVVVLYARSIVPVFT